MCRARAAHSTGHRRCSPGNGIGVSLGVRTTDEALAALTEVAAVADIAELRLDFMAECDLARLLSTRPCPVIVTNRPVREGGRFTGSEADRLRPLQAAIDLGADYVDIEHDSVSLLPAQRGTTRIIVSFHDFSATPPTLPRIAARLVEQGADVVKVVGMAQTPADNRYVLETFDQARCPTIAIGMGMAGLPSRVMALRYEQCFLTYATLGQGEQVVGQGRKQRRLPYGSGPPVAPGQLPVDAMHTVYQASAIGPETLAVGIVAPSLPPDAALARLNGALRQRGRDAVAVPFVLPETADVTALVRAYTDRRYGIGAWIVYPPHQQALGQPDALDRLQDKAATHGAVDLVIREPDGLYGLWVGSPTTAVVALDLTPG